MTAITVVGGYLGVGKTTALRALLAHTPAGRRVAVVVNDFGRTGFDGARLGDAPRVVAIDGGCLCCTAPAGFSAAVGSLVADGVDHVFVEPTGLARPEDLVDTLRRAPYRNLLEIRPWVGLVDPARLEDPDVRDRAARADILVANRWSEASDDQRAAFEAWIASIEPAPFAVVRTDHGALDPGLLGWPPGQGPRASASWVVRDGHTDHLAASLVAPPERVLDGAALVRALSAVPGLVRAKGWVRTELGYRRLEWVAGRPELAPTNWRRDSRLDVLVRGTVPPPADLLEGCTWRDQTAAGLEVAGPGGRTTRWLPDALADLDGLGDVGVALPGRVGAAASLAALWAACGIPGEVDIVFVAADGFVTPPLRASEAARGYLVYRLGSEPLPVGQGGPLRLLIPGAPSACANVKGVVRIAVVQGGVGA